jgi:8-oxo-dGTP diphosphatase
MLYLHEPPGFQPRVVAVGCMVQFGTKLLFLRRHIGRRYAGKWGCPAGKQEVGETSEDAAVRELREETGIHVPASALCYCGMRFVRYPEDQDFVYHQFWLKLLGEPEVTLNPGEHDAFAWMERAEAESIDYLGEPGDIVECLRMIPRLEVT